MCIRDSTKSAVEAGVSLELSFSMAMWLALFPHAVGVEIYLRLPPAKSERLRRVSYERQVEHGFKHLGSADHTVDRLGGAELWSPPMTERKAGVAETVYQSDTMLKVPLPQVMSRNGSANDISRAVSVMR